MEDEIKQMKLEYRNVFNKVNNCALSNKNYEIHLTKYECKIIIRYFMKLLDRIEDLEDLEEKKKIPEKIKIEQDKPSSYYYYVRNEDGTKCGLTKHSKMIIETLNQLIDYLKSKGE